MTPGNSPTANNANVYGELLGDLYVKVNPYLLNIRRHPLEEIQYFIIVNSIRVAQLLGKFVNACENKNALINKGGHSDHRVLQGFAKQRQVQEKFWGFFILFFFMVRTFRPREA